MSRSLYDSLLQRSPAACCLGRRTVLFAQRAVALIKCVCVSAYVCVVWRVCVCATERDQCSPHCVFLILSWTPTWSLKMPVAARSDNDRIGVAFLHLCLIAICILAELCCTLLIAKKYISITKTPEQVGSDIPLPIKSSATFQKRIGIFVSAAYYRHAKNPRNLHRTYLCCLKKEEVSKPFWRTGELCEQVYQQRALRRWAKRRRRRAEMVFREATGVFSSWKFTWEWAQDQGISWLTLSRPTFQEMKDW